MAKSNPFLEKNEEKKKKDLYDDGEKGEPFLHQKKVLGPKKALAMKGKKRGKK